MLSPHLVRQVELQAERIATELAERLHVDPHTPSYRRFPRETVAHYALAVYERLGAWLTGRSEQELESLFAPIGEDRYHEQVPLHELVYALILAKRQLRSHTHQVSSLSSASEIHSEMEFDAMIGRFFDKVIYAMVQGYEAARARASRDRPSPHAPGEPQKTHMGWVP